MSDEFREAGIEVFDRWTAMWNQELPAESVMAAAFTLRYAQNGAEAINAIHTPGHFSAAIAAWHGGHPGRRFFAEGTAVVDLTGDAGAANGIVARPYAAVRTHEGNTTTVSGIDMLRVQNGLVVEVWSVSAGGRAFYA